MISLVVALLIILNPLSTVPAYVSMHPHTPPKQLIHDATIVALGVLIILGIAAIAGDGILGLFGLEIEYFRIAGGLVIAWVAWNMAQGHMSEITVTDEHLQRHKQRKLDRGLIIPLVMPMTAGPGSIAFVISQSGDHNMIHLIGAIIIASTVVYLTMRYGSLLVDKLGDNGIKLMTRIIGILLLGISLQIIIGTILTLIKQ